jgi:predicted dehydrogenase
MDARTEDPAGNPQYERRGRAVRRRAARAASAMLADVRAVRPVSARPPAQARPIGTAVVGYGYWGPNLVRNVVERPELDMRILCDSDEARRVACQTRHPGVATVADFDRVLEDPSIEAVVIATAPRTHFALGRRALEAGKHVLVEKPMARTTSEARELITLARGSGRVLMPGHTFVYSPAVQLVRELIHDGVVGDVYFVTSSRMNLGKYQHDGVLCDLAPHDLSILLTWLDQAPVRVSAAGCSVYRSDVSETAFMTLGFVEGATANVQVSWLAPRKVRQMVVVGSKRMVVYDDTASDEPVRIYDRGMDFGPPASFGEYQLTYRSGEVVIPRVEPAEPLSLELADFAHAITTGARPRSNAELGLEIVGTLEAAESSLARHGVPVTLPHIAAVAPDVVTL